MQTVTFVCLCAHFSDTRFSDIVAAFYAWTAVIAPLLYHRTSASKATLRCVGFCDMGRTRHPGRDYLRHYFNPSVARHATRGMVCSLQKHPVCDGCEQHLQTHMNEPVLSLDRLAEPAIKVRKTTKKHRLLLHLEREGCPALVISRLTRVIFLCCLLFFFTRHLISSTWTKCASFATKSIVFFSSNFCLVC